MIQRTRIDTSRNLIDELQFTNSNPSNHTTKQKVKQIDDLKPRMFFLKSSLHLTIGKFENN